VVGMNKSNIKKAAIAAIVFVIIEAVFMYFGMMPVPESPTYNKEIKAIVWLAISGVLFFVSWLYLLERKEKSKKSYDNKYTSKE